MKLFGSRLEKILESLKWPTRELNLTDALLAQWKQDVELLIDLQIPYVKAALIKPEYFPLMASIESFQLGMH